MVEEEAEEVLPEVPPEVGAVPNLNFRLPQHKKAHETIKLVSCIFIIYSKKYLIMSKTAFTVALITASAMGAMSL